MTVKLKKGAIVHIENDDVTKIVVQLVGTSESLGQTSAPLTEDEKVQILGSAEKALDEAVWETLYPASLPPTSDLVKDVGRFLSKAFGWSELTRPGCRVDLVVYALKPSSIKMVYKQKDGSRVASIPPEWEIVVTPVTTAG